LKMRHRRRRKKKEVVAELGKKPLDKAKSLARDVRRLRKTN